MRLTTLCYIEENDKYLMLHRIKKEHDQSFGKWLGPGGKFEEGESPEECMLREVKEETGFTLKSYQFRGIVTFLSDEWETEYMFLYTSNDFEGTLSQCREGEFAWIEKEKLMDLELWEGDRIFLKRLIENAPFFSLKFCYKGDKLAQVQKF